MNRQTKVSIVGFVPVRGTLKEVTVSTIAIAQQNSRIKGAIPSAIVLLIYFSIYLKDYLSQYFPSSIFPILLGISISIGAITYLVQGISKKDQRMLFLVFCSILAMIASFISTQQYFINPYLIAPIIAVMTLRMNAKLFFTVLCLHFVVSILIQIYELSVGSYFYVYQAANGLNLDAKLFSGQAGIMRTKGLFQGPLSSTGFAMWMMFFFPSTLLIIGASVFSCIFSYGRLGIAATSFFFTLRFSTTTTIGYKYKVLVALVTMIGILAMPLILPEQNRNWDFFLEAFSLNSNGNMARMYYWTECLKLFASYDLTALLFGNFGEMKSQQLFAENDFIKIILDSGLLTLAIYLYAFSIAFILCIKRRQWIMVLSLLMIIVLMNIFPFIQSLTHTTLFWCYILLIFTDSVAQTYKKGRNYKLH